MKRCFLIFVFISSLATYAKAQHVVNDDTLYKFFHKNLKFDCSIPDSEKISTLLFFELKINKKGELTDIVSWNKEKWCNYISIKETFRKISEKWLKSNNNTTVLIPVLIMWDDENTISENNILSNIDYKWLGKMRNAGKTKFLKPFTVIFLKNNVT